MPQEFLSGEVKLKGLIGGGIYGKATERQQCLNDRIRVLERRTLLVGRGRPLVALQKCFVEPDR